LPSSLPHSTAVVEATEEEGEAVVAVVAMAAVAVVVVVARVELAEELMAAVDRVGRALAKCMEPIRTINPGKSSPQCLTFRSTSKSSINWLKEQVGSSL
jgi:hypothetical protein